MKAGHCTGNFIRIKRQNKNDKEKIKKTQNLRETLSKPL